MPEPARYPGLSGYDVEAVVRAFDILRATGSLEDFVKECRGRGTQIYLQEAEALFAKAKLIAAMPALQSDHDRYVEIFGKNPGLMRHAPDECPACPYR